MTAQGHIKKVKVDNDSQVNKMPFKEHKKIAGSSPHMEICTHKLVSYSNDKLSVLGTVKLPVKFNAGVEQELTLNIAETNQPEINQPPNSTQDLGSIKVVLKTKPEEKLTKPSQSEIKTKSSQELQEEALQNCSQVFTGLGRLEKPYNIEVTPTVINPPRAIPAAPSRQSQRRAGEYGKARSNSKGWRTHILG